MEVVRKDRHLQIVGRNFTDKSSHQLVLAGCKGVIKDCNFSNGDTRLHRKDKTITSIGRRSLYTQIDGGGVLITGESELLFEDCVFEDNHSLMCGGAVSLQGSPGSKITFRRCVFRNNIAEHTGAAIDVLAVGQKVTIEDCEFENNHCGRWDNGHRGQITVLPGNKLVVRSTNFKHSKNGIDIDLRPSAYANAPGHKLHHSRPSEEPFSASKTWVLLKSWFKHPGTYHWV